MYIAFNNDTKRVVYVGNEKPSIGGNATIAEVDTVPQEYDYLTVINEQEINEGSRTYITCDLVANFIPQLTNEQLALLNEQNKHKKYKELCRQYIRQIYSIDDELEIGRKKDTEPEQFAKYYDDIEKCLKTAHVEVYGE